MILVPTTSEPAGHTRESGIKVKVGVGPFKAALRRTATRWRVRRVDWSAERGRGKRIGRAPIGLAAQALGRADLSRVGVAGAGEGTSEAAAGAASKSVFESAGAAAAARRATGQSRVACHRRENGRAATNRAARRGAMCSKVLRLGSAPLGSWRWRFGRLLAAGRWGDARRAREQLIAGWGKGKVEGAGVGERVRMRARV